MTPYARKRVVSELRKHGATREQALGYVRLAKQFEKESKELGELHHLLPANCGWFKIFKNCKWNLVRITWAAHICLHAYLMHLFKENRRLAQAVIAVSMRRNPGNPKKHKFKNKIIKWYELGDPYRIIAKRVGVSPWSIIDWLKKWGIKTQLKRENAVPLLRTKLRLKLKIIRLYKNGARTRELAKMVGCNSITIWLWLRKWNVAKNRAEAHSDYRKEKLKHKIIKYYNQGKSFRWIGKKLGIHKCTLPIWLTHYGIKT